MVAVLVDGNRAGAVVHAFADGRVVLLPLTSINVPAGRALEVWTLPSRERGPVSVGLMDRARTLELQLKDLPRPGPDQLFEITLEPAGGSPTGRPTGPILFKGNTAQTLVGYGTRQPITGSRHDPRNRPDRREARTWNPNSKPASPRPRRCSSAPRAARA